MCDWKGAVRLATLYTDNSCSNFASINFVVCFLNTLTLLHSERQL